MEISEVVAKATQVLPALLESMPAGYRLVINPVDGANADAMSDEDFQKAIAHKVEPSWVFADLRDSTPKWFPVPATWTTTEAGSRGIVFLLAAPNDKKAAERVDPVTLLPEPVQESLKSQEKISTALAAYLRQLIGQPGCRSDMTLAEVREWLEKLPRTGWAFLRGAEERRDAPDNVGTTNPIRPPELRTNVDVRLPAQVTEKSTRVYRFDSVRFRMSVPESWLTMSPAEQTRQVTAMLGRDPATWGTDAITNQEPTDVTVPSHSVTGVVYGAVESMVLAGNEET